MKKQPSAISHQPSAISSQLSALSYQPSAIGYQRSEKASLASFILRHAFCPVLLVLALSLFSAAQAKIYLDITSPAIRRLPITIKTSGTPAAREIESIVKSDLEFTGLFTFVDPDVRGAEIIASIDVETALDLKVIVSVRDLIDNREVLRKRFSAARIRPLAHSIANDIYYVATGKQGVFRTKISYLVNSDAGKKELHIMDWDGAQAFKLVSKGLTTSHSWSQNGKFLLYSSERDRKWKIYILDLQRYREMILLSSKGLNLVGGTSPDDLVSLSSSKDGSSEIYTIDLMGKDLKKLTRSFGIDVSPVFSSKGDRIAFVSDRGGTPQIYVMNPDGREIQRVSYEGSYNTSPAWSPDARWIAYTGRTNGKNQLFMVKSDGTETRQLTFSGNNESPSFSPDGLFLAFDSDRDGVRGIYLMGLYVEGLKRITPGNVKATAPKWSPYLQ